MTHLCVHSKPVESVVAPQRSRHRSRSLAEVCAGNFIGPTLLTKVTPTMRCYQEEIFGPVLVALDADSLDDAISIVNSNVHGNGCAIFTKSGHAARKFQHEVDVGMVRTWHLIENTIHVELQEPRCIWHSAVHPA